MEFILADLTMVFAAKSNKKTDAADHP